MKFILVFRSSNIGIGILIVLFFFSGCDNSLDPMDEDKGRYSIYGYLDLNKDINHIRVKDLNTTFLQDSTSEIDAEVTLQNLKNGAAEKLKDIIIDFDSVKTHNFRTTMEIQPNTEYRVSVERSDGKVSSATATTPYRAETNVFPSSRNCTTSVDINFNPARSSVGIELEVGFHYDDKEFWVRANKFLVESDKEVTASFTPWDILDEAFGPGSSEDVIQEDELAVFCDRLDNETFMVRYTHYGPDIYANATSDTLQIPGGTGRFGALYKESFSFRVDTTKLCPPYDHEVCLLGHPDKFK